MAGHVACMNNSEVPSEFFISNFHEKFRRLCGYNKIDVEWIRLA
jgi:hypothetical protein